jgi:methyl-accepting chemotaxis protein
MNITSVACETHRRGDILSVNNKFVEVSKYSRAELIGKPYSTTRYPDMPKETFKQLLQTIGSGNTFRGAIKRV